MVMAADLEQVTLFGGVVSVTQLTATYNSLPLHSRPLAQNYISNTLLRHLSPDTEKLGITVATHPLPEPKTVRATPTLYQSSAVALLKSFRTNLRAWPRVEPQC